MGSSGVAVLTASSTSFSLGKRTHCWTYSPTHACRGALSLISLFRAMASIMGLLLFYNSPFSFIIFIFVLLLLVAHGRYSFPWILIHSPAGATVCSLLWQLNSCIGIERREWRVHVDLQKILLLILIQRWVLITFKQLLNTSSMQCAAFTTSWRGRVAIGIDILFAKNCRT